MFSVSADLVAIGALWAIRNSQSLHCISSQLHTVDTAILALAQKWLIKFGVNCSDNFNYFLRWKLLSKSQIPQFIVRQKSFLLLMLTFLPPLDRIDLVFCQRSFPVPWDRPLLFYLPGNHKLRRDRYMLHSRGIVCNTPRLFLLSKIIGCTIICHSSCDPDRRNRQCRCRRLRQICR